jgi:Double zinc ribbon
MEYEQRERRDPLDEDAQTSSPEPSDADVLTPDEAPPDPIPDGDAATPAEPAPAEIESWPSQDGAATEPIAEEPATEAGESESTPEQAWPTEPPAAGSASEDAWPTTPPERGGEPILEPDATDTAHETDAAVAAAAAAQAAAEPVPPAPEAAPPGPAAESEPPPEEVEAYPAAVAAAGAAAAGAAHAVPEGEGATGESTQCPRCGTENRPGLAFCRNCGQRLVAAGVASTVERPGTPEGTMACPRCGTHNRAGTAFCQNCGANLRGTAPGYVPPAAVGAEATDAEVGRRGAVLGPVVLLIGIVGLVTAYFLPFAYGTGSLYERAFGEGGWGIAFWNGYADIGGSIADSAYFGLAAAVPILAVILLGLAVAGFMQARPGPAQTAFLVIALVWSVGLIVMFLVAEVFANWGGDLVGLLRELTPAGIIFFLSSLIVLIGTLTRFARS